MFQQEPVREAPRPTGKQSKPRGTRKVYADDDSRFRPWVFHL